MTCKDCYHYEMCLPRVAVGGNKICQYFKDKSLIVELPCKVGGYVYYVALDFNNVRIPKKAKVISFGINENGVFDVELEGEWSTFVLPINKIFFNIHCVEKYLKELNKK